MFDELPTEHINPRTVDIDRLDTLGVLQRLNDEDQSVAPAVRAALPELARAVDLALERWQRGGRVVLFGAGTSGRLATLDATELGPTFGIPAERYLARLAGGGGAFFTASGGGGGAREARRAGAGGLFWVGVAPGLGARWRK